MTVGEKPDGSLAEAPAAQMAITKLFGSSTLSKLSKKPATWRPVRLLDAPARPPQPGVTPTPHTGPPSGGARATRAAPSCLSVFFFHPRGRLSRGGPPPPAPGAGGGGLVRWVVWARGGG